MNRRVFRGGKVVAAGLCAGIAVVGMVIGGACPVSARSRAGADRANRRAIRQEPAGRIIPDGARSLGRVRTNGVFRGAAAVSTTWLATYSFDAGGTGCIDEGWSPVDLTGQAGDFFHVDDGTGLDGGDYGRLVPLSGAQSMWCGASPDPVDPGLCGYQALPGYGNGWDQSFEMISCLNPTGDLKLKYLIAWDSEPGYDYTYVEYDSCDDNWQVLKSYDNVGTGVDSAIVVAASHGGQVRLRFHFSSDGAYSDQDGLWGTDGAVILDDVTVSDATGVLLGTEGFEVEARGDHVTQSGNWRSSAAPGYGDFSGLFPGGSIVQETNCGYNRTCLWGFFSGSTDNYACGGFPLQAVVPSGDANGNTINNGVRSPRIPYVGSGDQLYLSFDVYRDLPLDPLVFYQWAVRSIVVGCPAQWRKRDFVFYGAGKDWLRSVNSIGDLVETGTESMEIQLAVVDMCQFWCGVYGTGACHSHAPLFDNVSLYRIDAQGPQWTVRDIDTFQDTFASDGTLTGTARADMALDILGYWTSTLRPGDSTVVTAADPVYGIGLDAYTSDGPAVYAYVSVRPGGQPGKSGAGLTDDASRWPVVDSVPSGGRMWYVVRFDTVLNSSGSVSPDKYCLDLNDDLFTPGDTVFFFYAAKSAAPSEVETYYSLPVGASDNINDMFAAPMEFTILPAGGYLRGGSILYVDAMDQRGSQPFFDTAFEMMGILDKVDRYDVRGPSSAVANHPSDRVKNVLTQLVGPYRTIIWDSGNLSQSVPGDGVGTVGKSNDQNLLFEFLDNRPDVGGVYLTGDEMGEGLSSATAFTSKFLSYLLVSQDHAPTVGVSPRAVGLDKPVADPWPAPFLGDTLLAYGGCPYVNDFDVITGTGTAYTAMRYEGNGTSAGASVADTTLNKNAVAVGVLLDGFGFYNIRDDRPAGLVDRAVHLNHALAWLGNAVYQPVGAPTPGAVDALAQNYPNPFNPTTTIRYSIAARAHVELRIYDVAGRLVRTLVNRKLSPAQVRPVTWDGRNDGGLRVASGVYFYRLRAADFVKTRKMVVLK